MQLLLKFFLGEVIAIGNTLMIIKYMVPEQFR